MQGRGVPRIVPKEKWPQEVTLTHVLHRPRGMEARAPRAGPMRRGGESQEDDEVIPELRPHSVGLADRIASGNMVGARQEGETWVGPMTLAKAPPTELPTEDWAPGG